MKKSELPSATRVNRRSLLCGVALVTLGLAANVIPDSAQAATGIKVLKSGKLQVTIAANKALAKVGGAVILQMQDGSELGIVRTAPGIKGFAALSLTCPHNGATVLEQGNQWLCPAHGSLFSLSGALIQGPARQALSKYPLAATAKYLIIG